MTGLRVDSSRRLILMSWCCSQLLWWHIVSIFSTYWRRECLLVPRWAFPLGTRRCCDVESTSIQHRNNVVCPSWLRVWLRYYLLSLSLLILLNEHLYCCRGLGSILSLFTRAVPRDSPLEEPYSGSKGGGGAHTNYSWWKAGAAYPTLPNTVWVPLCVWINMDRRGDTVQTPVWTDPEETSAGFTLGQRRRRWPNVEPAFFIINVLVGTTRIMLDHCRSASVCARGNQRRL